MFTQLIRLPRRAPRFFSPLLDIAVRRHAQPAPRPINQPSQPLFPNLETTMTKMIPATVALAAVLCVAGAARAETPRMKVMQVPVAYRTADLETPQGARALLTSVNSLALRMCRSGGSALQHPVAAEIEACREKAVSRAVSELNAPLVTAAYGERWDGSRLAVLR